MAHFPDQHPVNEGLLGADYEVDKENGRYRFKKIYPGENWDGKVRSPLTEPGVNVKEGDYLIDGYPGPGFPSVTNPADPNDQVAVLLGNDSPMVVGNFNETFEVVQTVITHRWKVGLL